MVSTLVLAALCIATSGCSDTTPMQQLNARCEAGNRVSCEELDSEKQQEALRRYPEGPPAMLAPPGSGMFGVEP